MCCCTIKRFCWMRLQTAGVVIGWVSGVISLIQSIGHIVVLANLESILKSLPLNSYGVRDNLAFELFASVISVVLSARLAVYFLDFLASISLIFGAKRNSHLMLLPWLINNIIVLVFSITFNFVFMCVAAVNSGPVGLPIVFFLILGIYCWAWIAICSLFRSLRDNKVEGDVETPDDYKQFHNSELVSESRY